MRLENPAQIKHSSGIARGKNDKLDARKNETGKILPWVHIATGNAKRMLLDIFHDIKPEHLQNYLNEFCYKFNRKSFGENLFDRLMIAAVCYKNQFRYNIV